MKQLTGTVVDTKITEDVVHSEVITVKVGEYFPVPDELSDDEAYLYQGAIEQEDGRIQLKIGKRIYHSSRYSDSYEIQESLYDVKKGDVIKVIDTKYEDSDTFYEVNSFTNCLSNWKRCLKLQTEKSI